MREGFGPERTNGSARAPVKSAGQPAPGKSILEEEFESSLEPTFLKVLRQKGWAPEQISQIFGKKAGQSGAEISTIGIRPFIRTVYSVLSEYKGWTREDVADAIYILLKQRGGRYSRQVNPSNILKMFLGGIEEAKDISHHHYSKHIGEELAEIWPHIGAVTSHWMPVLEFDRGDLVSTLWSTPGELYSEIVARIEKAASAARVTTSVAIKDEPGLEGLDRTPDLDTTQLEVHEAALEKLEQFASSGRNQVFTFVGEPLSGKTTLLRNFVEALKAKAKRENLQTPRILHLDFAELRGFEAVVGRVRGFLDADERGGLWSDESWSGSTEMKLRGIVTAAGRSSSGVLFLMNGASATIRSGHVGGGRSTPSCLLRDDRLDRLVELLTTLNKANRVVLAISPDVSPRGASNIRGVGGRQINLELPDLSLRQLKGMLKPFASEHRLSEDDLANLIKDLNKPLGWIPVQAEFVGGRYLMSALALLWLAREQTSAGKAVGESTPSLADEKALIRAADPEFASVKPIIARIYERLREDPHGRVVTSLLAFSDGGMRKSRLADLLRYHRQMFQLGIIANVPENCSGQDRFALCKEDTKLIDALAQRLRFLVKEHAPALSELAIFSQGARADARRSGSDESAETMQENILEINKVLRPTLCEVIEEADPALSSECHLVLARFHRRQGMRARLARPGLYGATLDDLEHDLSVIEHLLASIRPMISGQVPAPSDIKSPHDREWQVFTASDQRPSTLLRFAADDVLSKDINHGSQHRLTGVLQADDVVVTMMRRFFHLGRSAPAEEQHNKHHHFIDGINRLLDNKLPVCSVTSIVTSLAVAGLQQHDFSVLWPAVGLDSQLRDADAGVDLLRLRLVHLDALVLVGRFSGGHDALRADEASGQEPFAEELAFRWLSEVGCTVPTPPATWSPDVTQSGGELVEEFASEVMSKLGPANAWTCGKLLARLGRVAHFTTPGNLALWRFALAEALAARTAAHSRFPLLSGTSGRHWLAALLAFAARSRDENNPKAFEWAKRRAEDVHRHNLRRLGVFPFERAGAVIDEAMLERQVRGAGGAGDLESAHKVIEGAYANALDTSASATIRLEFGLERARAAMYLGEFHDGTPRGRRLTDSALGVAIDLINKISSRYMAASRNVPSYILSEAYFIRAKCSLDVADANDMAERSRNIKQAHNLLVEDDISTLVDHEARARRQKTSWSDEALMA